ncbi:hypothetical protein V5E97_33185 [Singulisphaera sp. Ch08]|uniref:Uncharacterized protein n=1 Tax=Singulisphaera sp. Ch08 TaxID=3120278 RepID=A0AAU7CDF7_9BACT
MTTRRSNTNIILVAFVAIMGMLSFADVASACTMTKSSSASQACCASRPSNECGCCGKVETLPSSDEPSLAVAITSAPARLNPQATLPSCECRASEPAAPSERPAQPSTSGRDEVQSCKTLAVITLTVRLSQLHQPVLNPNESPLRFPLYLRTSHFLI